MRPKRLIDGSRGFTLIELMMVIAIAAIMVTLAVPGMRDLILKLRASSAVNELLGAIQQARSEAVKNNDRILICASSSGVGCSGSWAEGWLVWYDLDFDGALDTDEILSKGKAQTDFTVTAKVGSNAYSAIRVLQDGTPQFGTMSGSAFSPLGSSPKGPGTFRFCYQTTLERLVTIEVTGRPTASAISPPSGC